MLTKNEVKSLKVNNKISAIIFQNPTITAGEIMKTTMEIKKITTDALVNATGVSVATISRLRRNECKTAFDNVIRLCIALDLSCYNSFKLIAALGYSPDKATGRESVIYNYMSSYGKNIEECDRLLVEMGYEGLTYNL